ncbi:MAG TPA: FHA domain-containing serine/threonine-protein kinase [Gemmataceae bacterium]|nr:FHA domain-containing serine/threonine-protein kinase [Gemmataceae bacterium]
MSAKLIAVGGPEKGQVYELPESKKVTLGRGDAATIRIPDPTISRLHCAIDLFGGDAILTDSGSKSGTKVNNKTITEHHLQSGEVITLGTSHLRYVYEAPIPIETHKDEDATDPEELRKLSGSKLGHFDLGKVAALGRSGVVFQAYDFKEDREVALKVYLPEFAENDEDLQRFIRAVKTMLPMRHPNVVTLYGGGKTGPYCWMAMEFVDGESLTETINRVGKSGKLDWRTALRIALDLSRGLNYIHSEKIIHRNLSPGNVLFSRLGVAKMGSLILAKALSGALAKDVTVGGELLGDVRFQAPEQVGAGGPVDGRADIFSLGTLVYALFTGKPPFEGRSPVLTAAAILQREPIPPRKVNPDIPEPVERIVLKMLAKRPADRYQSAADLLAAMEELPKM